MIDGGRVLCVRNVRSLDPDICLRCVRVNANAVSGLISMSLKKKQIHKSIKRHSAMIFFGTEHRIFARKLVI